MLANHKWYKATITDVLGGHEWFCDCVSIRYLPLLAILLSTSWAPYMFFPRSFYYCPGVQLTHLNQPASSQIICKIMTPFFWGGFFFCEFLIFLFDFFRFFFELNWIFTLNLGAVAGSVVQFVNILYSMSVANQKALTCVLRLDLACQLFSSLFSFFCSLEIFRVHSNHIYSSLVNFAEVSVRGVGQGWPNTGSQLDRRNECPLKVGPQITKF